MRGLVVMAMFVASLAHANWNDFEEKRTLTQDAGNVNTLSIKAGAGSMDVNGVSGSDSIRVTAFIRVSDADEAEAAKIIEKRMVLSLKINGDVAQLNAWFDDSFMGLGANAHIVLEVDVPKGMAVNIDDGSGSIDIDDVEGDIRIDDGSGSISVNNVASVEIDDGSGSIDVSDAAGDVLIVDGSGSITVRGVLGSVSIDDGSGSISIEDVERELVIVDDGSGGLSFSDIRGGVEQKT